MLIVDDWLGSFIQGSMGPVPNVILIVALAAMAVLAYMAGKGTRGKKRMLESSTSPSAEEYLETGQQQASPEPEQTNEAPINYKVTVASQATATMPTIQRDDSQPFSFKGSYLTVASAQEKPETEATEKAADDGEYAQVLGKVFADFLKDSLKNIVPKLEMSPVIFKATKTGVTAEIPAGANIATMTFREKSPEREEQPVQPPISQFDTRGVEGGGAEQVAATGEED